MSHYDGAALAGRGGGPLPARLSNLRVGRLAVDLEPMQRAADVPELFGGLAQAVSDELRADACLVSLIDEDDGVVRDVAGSGTAAPSLGYMAKEYRLRDYPMTRRVIESGRSEQVSVADKTADEGERAILAEHGFARVLISRIAVDGRPTGIVETYRLEDRPFSSEDSNRVDTLSAFAANSYSRMELAARLEANYTETMEALLSALEARDPYTQAHTGRIRDMAVAVAVALQVPTEMHRAIRLGAILHDVGKIGVPDRILLKPGPLTDMETQVMRSHPIIGERMLKKIDFLVPALPIIRHHHERWDGTGYPDGLAGEAIPVGARIVSVCDALDAMTSDRPYRKAASLEEACSELRAGSATQFDPLCADLLVEIVSHPGDGSLEQRVVRFVG